MEAHSYSAHTKTSSPKLRRKHPPLFISPTNAVAPYILLRLLLKMRAQLSREMTDRFTEDYLRMVEEHYPLLKEIVAEVLKDSNVKDIYKEVVGTEKG